MMRPKRNSPQAAKPAVLRDRQVDRTFFSGKAEQMTDIPTKWTQKNLPLGSLLLDEANPRLPGERQRRSQDELIAYLVEYQHVYEEVAKSIARNGFYPNEALIAIREPSLGKKSVFTVIEGNRRLAALKSLAHPEILPENKQNKFRALAAKANTPTSVPVFIAPSRLAAAPFIFSRHTQKQVAEWTPANQGKAFRHLLEDGQTIDDVVSLTGIVRGEVLRHLRYDALYRMACGIDLGEKVNRKVRFPANFGITTLERIFQHQPFRERLGVDWDDEKILKGTVKADAFQRAFSRIVTDIAEGNETSRSLQNEGDLKRYMKDLETAGVFPDPKADKGRFTFDNLSGAKPSAATTEPPKKGGKAPKRAQGPSKSIIPRDIRKGSISSSTRIREVFEELKGIKIETQRNATALLFRTLVDLCTTNYINKKGYMEALLAHYHGDHKSHHKGGKKAPEHAPTLRQMLHWLIDNHPPFRGQALSALRRFADPKNQEMCLDDLDKFTHNVYIVPTADKLRAIWEQLDPYMRLVLSDPEEPDTGDASDA